MKARIAAPLAALLLASVVLSSAHAAGMRTVYPLWKNPAWSADSSWRTNPASYATWVKADTTAPFSIQDALWTCTPPRLGATIPDSSWICITVQQEVITGNVPVAGLAGLDSTTVKLQASADGKVWVTQAGNLTYLTGLAAQSWATECLRLSSVAPAGVNSIAAYTTCCGYQFMRVIVNWDTPTAGTARRSRVKVTYPTCTDDKD